MKRIAILVGAGALSAVVAAGALAHSDATGIVKERMDLMSSMGDAMKALAEMFRDKAPYDAERVRELARVIEQHGGAAMTSKFPEDSIHGPSEALPSIWADWDRFADLADQVEAYAGALGAAADNERPPHGAGMGQGGMRQGGMMGGRQGMMQGGQGMMMGTGQGGPSAEHLAQMPPDAAFRMLAETCSACHADFRKKK